MLNSSVVEYYSNNPKIIGSSPRRGWHVLRREKRIFLLKNIICSPARRPIITFRNRIAPPPLHHPLKCTFVGPTTYLTPDNQAQHPTVSGTEWVHGLIPKGPAQLHSIQWRLDPLIWTANRKPAGTLTGEIWTCNLCLINCILKPHDQKGYSYFLFFCL